MAKWLKDYLSFGSRRAPPQPPKPDYTESEILKAYRIQKSLDFEDPYENSENRNGSVMSDVTFGSPLKSGILDLKSPKHRLIKVESQDLGRNKILLSSVVSFEETDPVVPSAPPDAGDLDYSDPFDARPDPRPAPEPAPAPPGSNGYMEPYEAQRLLTQLQRGSGCGRSRGGVQLYDTPYEERARGRGRGVQEDDGQESRLPQDDERPADEYDQPWEWKKEHISKALAGRHAHRHTHISKALAGRHAHRHTHIYRDTPTDTPTSPRPWQIWILPSVSSSYFPSLSLSLSLSCCPSLSLSLPPSLSPPLLLSLRSCQGFMHMKFSVSREGKYILGQNSPPFDTIPEVIHFYTTHKLPIRGAEHLSLLFPVVVQTL
ncbi:SH2 domain-containing adapter protein D-like [Anguilla anguilla]|uniref:SH2 domain-containing adapter protein D-like n=1 Tax=Anguilla anguilla TaxID=7936 RepID=UPI0015AA9061|nr:SH2 domain-containing adapter protein D-like [Anguilla anguilla]